MTTSQSYNNSVAYTAMNGTNSGNVQSVATEALAVSDALHTAGLTTDEHHIVINNNINQYLYWALHGGNKPLWDTIL